ncbi:MAG: cytochrome c3 family protein [Acidobacteria bacterium]|nr:cytochrome c3 family protein [Acidobacteriota bacterium]
MEALTLLPDNKDGYVGSETCSNCHEGPFKSFSATKHSKLSQLDGWKDKVQGCESCHGPGKEHVEGGGDKTKIISFKNKNSKEVSETCLACHAGKESHNNFRRGDHWRNDVGCADCHTAHGPEYASFKAESIVTPGETTVETPSNANFAMLKKSEPQLCISCHTETKAQFVKPNHHKVLEGAMKCSDCHNAHGGFEQKQVNLSVGNDAACVKCHLDKQGPFVFEHGPVKTEGCTACHTPHGSANPKMLKRPQIRQLCLECHSGITDQAAEGPTGGPHSQATATGQNCTTCHVAIHGSNTSNVFFR